MIKRKYDTLFVHVEDVHFAGPGRWAFCETRYHPLVDIPNARFYIRLSGCVNVADAYVIFGGLLTYKLMPRINLACSYSVAGFASPPYVKLMIDEGSVEMAGEGNLVKGCTSMFIAGSRPHYTGPDISLTIEEYILEGGERKVYMSSCNVFRWIGDVFLVIAQILRDIGDRMGTVWFVGDVIQGWFNAAAGYFEGTRDWFYTAAEWCEGVVASLLSGDVLTWLLGFFSDPGGYIMGFLGSVWTDLQDMYANFYSWVIGVLGDPWTWLQGLYSDFSGAVTSILGDTWTWLQTLHSDFSGAVTSILGDTWTWLLTLYGDFTGAVTGALGGVWEWLTEFINDPMSKLSLDMLDLVKSGFEWLTQEWFSFIDSTWDTFKGSFTWLMQKFFILLDESWDTFEDSMKWLVGKTMDLVGDAAEDFKDKIWEMIEKVVKKL